MIQNLDENLNSYYDLLKIIVKYENDDIFYPIFIEIFQSRFLFRLNESIKKNDFKLFLQVSNQLFSISIN